MRNQVKYAMGNSVPSPRRKVAIFGFVNADEALARWLRAGRTPLEIHAFSLAPNAAFEQCCDAVYRFRPGDPELQRILKREAYDLVYVGPIPAVLAFSSELQTHAIPFVGPTAQHIKFELDKTKIFEALPEPDAILPKTAILTDSSPQSVSSALSEFPSGYVLKFNGDFSRYYDETEAGRVRLSDETISREEVFEFVRRSIESSGSVIIQEKLIGKDFSANYLVDKNEGLFPIGENVCYKRRNDFNRGPMTDGTGSVSWGGQVPFLTARDRERIHEAVGRFVRHVNRVVGIRLTGFLNADLIKTVEGRVYLCEVNFREPGVHTLASLYRCLNNDLFDLLLRARNGELAQLSPVFDPGVSVVVSAYPPYYPYRRPRSELTTVKVSKKVPPGISLFTGWVELLSESETWREFLLMSAPSLTFEAHETSLERSRKIVYKAMESMVPSGLLYRRDIGL